MNLGAAGGRSLNVELQKALNPPGALRVERFGTVYGVGDKVMQVVNDYDKEVYNGDIGRIAGIDPNQAELVIRFDARDVTYRFEELDAVVLAYATTIHKSQGSEYPVVVISLVLQHQIMLHRNLLLHRRHPRQATGRPGRGQAGLRGRRLRHHDQAPEHQAQGVGSGISEQPMI